MKNLEQLEKTAIELALSHKWEKAIKINKEIIDIDKTSIPALNRLGKAYLAINLKDKATKIFENVLKIDPNNKVAQKNLTEQSVNTPTTIDTSSLIKEPGTSAYTNIKITSKFLKAKNLQIAQPLKVKIAKKVSVCDENDNFIGYLSNDIANKIIKNKIKESEIKASVVGKKRGKISVLIKTEKPIFTSSKEDIIPFIGEGEEELIEDAIDMTTTENQADVKARETVGGIIEEEEEEDILDDNDIENEDEDM